MPRYRCKTCRTTFSEQTFRYDYRQKRPELDELCFRNFVSGMGQRQMARVTRSSRDTVARKLLRLAEQCQSFHDALARKIDGFRHLSFDELETFEQCRVSMPVTMGTLIDLDSMFIVEQGNATMSPRRTNSPRSQRIIRRHTILHGPRAHRSRECVEAIFRRGASRFAASATFELSTDRKSTYPTLARGAFGERLLEHHRFSSKMRRGPGSPLHRINLTNAMWRDNLGRLHRRSWLVSKSRVWLARHSWLFVAYRNYIRPRFNGETRTPGELIGVQKGKIDFGDILDYRLDLEFGMRRLRHHAA